MFDSGKVFERDEEGKPIRAAGIHLEITERKRQEIQNRRVSNFVKLSKGIMQKLVNGEDIQFVINELLEKTGQYMDVSRAYLFKYKENHTKVDNTHEWCNDDVESQIDVLQDIPVEEIQWWHQKMEQGNMIFISDIKDTSVPESIRDILEPQGITALLAIPMYVNQKLYGFMGFDVIRGPRYWLFQEVATLKNLVDTVSHAVEREGIEKEKRELEKMKTINQLAITIAHEFNNPLAIIKLRVDLLKRNGMNPEKIEKSLETVSEQVFRMSDLVDKLMKLEILKDLDYANGIKIFDLKKAAS